MLVNCPVRWILKSFNPYRVIACYAIFFVVRADCDTSSDLSNGASGVISDELLLRSVLEEEALTSQLCDVFQDALIEQHNPRDDFPIPSVEKESASCDYSSSYENGASSDETFDEQPPYENILTPLPVFSLASRRVQNGACRKHSRIFLREIKRYRYWALQMYDAAAKLPSGVLRGNANQLGDFDECLSVDSGILSPSGRDRVRGKYCLASVHLEAAPTAAPGAETLHDAVHRAQAFGFITNTLNDPGHFIPRFTSINWALCVPASCGAADVQLEVAQTLSRFNGSSGLQLDVIVEPRMCYEQGDKHLGVAAMVSIALYVAVMLVAVVATFWDRPGAAQSIVPGKLERMVMAFSLRKNVTTLLEPLPVEGDIHCIHGVRAICTLALYVAHKVITLALMPYTNRVELTETSNDPLSSVLRSSIVYTDSFLLLSGVLTSYHLTKEVERKGTIDWLQRCLARFIRLTPALVALVVFYAFVFEHVGHGPQWGRVVQHNADICKSHLWRNILYIQNFFPFEEMCATHTHQLALDMQLSLVAPPLVYLLHHYPRGGAALLVLLHFGSAALRYTVSMNHRLSLIIYHGIPVVQLFKSANLLYSLSLHRATPYLMGVGLGYCIKKTGKNIHIPKTIVRSGWLLAAGLAYYSLLSRSAEAQRDFQYDVWDASVYAAWSPVSWALALGWLIFACFTGHGGLMNKFLSCRVLVVFSRISYAVYLTQFVVFFYNVGVIRSTQQFNVLRSVGLEEMVVVLVLSVVVALLFDLPMQEIKGIICGDGRAKSPKRMDQCKLPGLKKS